MSPAVNIKPKIFIVFTVIIFDISKHVIFIAHKIIKILNTLLFSY